MTVDQRRFQKAIVDASGLTAQGYRYKMGRPTPW